MSEKVSHETVNNQKMLAKILNAIVTELTAVRTLANELRTDHATNIACIAANKALVNSIRASLLADGIINATVLSAGTTTHQIASTAFQFWIDGVTETKAAVAAGTAFTAADTINTGTASGNFWGGWRVQIATGGTISTKSVGADQVYTTEALAIAAIPAADALNTSMGYLTVQSNTDVAWTAATDDLVAESDCLDVNFYPEAAAISAAVSLSPAATLTAAAITQQVTGTS